MLRCFNTVNGMTVHVILCLVSLEISRLKTQNGKTSLKIPFYSIEINEKAPAFSAKLSATRKK